MHVCTECVRCVVSFGVYLLCVCDTHVYTARVDLNNTTHTCTPQFSAKIFYIFSRKCVGRALRVYNTTHVMSGYSVWELDECKVERKANNNRGQMDKQGLGIWGN